jgi:hypothetical protein
MAAAFGQDTQEEAESRQEQFYDRAAAQTFTGLYQELKKPLL